MGKGKIIVLCLFVTAISASAVCAEMLTLDPDSLRLTADPRYLDNPSDQPGGMPGADPLYQTDQSGHTSAAKEVTQPPSTCIFCKAYGETLLQDTRHIMAFPTYWSRNDWLVFSGVVTGVGVMMAYGDKPIERRIQANRNDYTSAAATVVTPFGFQYAFGIMGGLYLMSAFTHNTKGKLVTLDCISATTISWGIMAGLTKEATGRQRPYSHDGPEDFDPLRGTSFPSGHTTEAFALASVLSTHYKSYWVRVPAFGIAGLVGLARMDKDKHWTSDVIAGALLGGVVGREIVHFNRRERAKLVIKHQEHHLAFYPAFDRRGASLNLAID